MPPCLSLSDTCSFTVNCDSSQFAQWVGLVPVSEGVNNKVKNKFDVHDWMTANLALVHLLFSPPT